MPSSSPTIALVTGGSRGIGRAIARRLANDGAVVAVHYGHDADAAEKTVEDIVTSGGRAFAIRAELGVPGDAAALWSEFDSALAGRDLDPGVDIIVNNAGITVPKSMSVVDEADYDRVFAINVKAPFFVVQQGLDRMRDNGRIINISSGATRFALPRIIAYSMTKGALETFTLTLAEALGPRGITVNAVSPGFTQTAINPTLTQEKALAEAKGVSTFGRLGQPDDIADVVGFLAGSDGRWVTGHVLDATGGGHLGF